MGRSSGILLHLLRIPRSSRIGQGILVTCVEMISIALLNAAQPVSVAEPKDIAVELKTASALHQRADYAHSIPLLKQIVKVSPQNYLANLLLGEDLLRSGKPQDALGPLQAASAARPEEVD